MATPSYAKALVGALPADLKRALGSVWDYLLTNTLSFGPIDAGATQTNTVNFAGRYVSFTTASSPDTEVAVAHGLGRSPNVLWPVMNPRAVGAKLVRLEVTRAPDTARVYVRSPETNAPVTLYIE